MATGSQILEGPSGSAKRATCADRAELDASTTRPNGNEDSRHGPAGEPQAPCARLRRALRTARENAAGYRPRLSDKKADECDPIAHPNCRLIRVEDDLDELRFDLTSDVSITNAHVEGAYADIAALKRRVGIIERLVQDEGPDPHASDFTAADCASWDRVIDAIKEASTSLTTTSSTMQHVTADTLRRMASASTASASASCGLMASRSSSTARG
jgi:hypothetical protein